MDSSRLATVIADSVHADTGDRITTFILPRFPKVLLQELNTHRVFSRNAASSRAIPVAKMVEKVKSDPYIPRFTKAKKGMQGIEDNDEEFQQKCKEEWAFALDDAIDSAYALLAFGCHKQNANRLLEPFIRVPVIVTATRWDNFFKLRCHTDAHPDFREVAIAMRDAMRVSESRSLSPGMWHIPMFDESMEELTLSDKRVVATARCARVSYANHDGSVSSLDNDTQLHDRLLSSGHLSPFEHCAEAMVPSLKTDCKNFDNWQSYRAQLEEVISKS
ncbi:alternative thymidylate synthase [Leptolyngbya sp. PCC 7375]|nr:alternative thymidylate synthase [Leptolyngbya sp. PCC 7375]